MLNKLLYKRGLRKYRKSYINILCVFILSLSMLSFTTIYCDSYYNYDDAVLIPMLTADHTCDIRVTNISDEETKCFLSIPNVESEYKNGNLDFYLTDTDEFETVLKQIQKTFNSNIIFQNSAAGINIFYGKDIRESIKDYHDSSTRFGTAVFQVVLSAIGIISMVLIYSDYIKQRTDDIRTLSAIGITEKQLRRLFFGECNALYFVSTIIGFPLGGILVYLFCKACEVVDMSGSNAIYPVFDLNLVSILITALAGYLVTNISFRIVLRKILGIDASYTCAESVMEFDPDRTRDLYNKADRHFDKFFATVLKKRCSSKFKILIIITALIISVAVFMINSVNYSVYIGNSNGVKDPAAVAAMISNSSIFIMTIVYALLYSLTIIIIFNKRQIESCASAVRTLYSLGADEYSVYSCFHLFTVKNIVASVGIGFAVGYGFTFLVFAALNYSFDINIWFVLANLVLAAAYYLVYMTSMRKFYIKNCLLDDFRKDGGAYGTT